MINNPRLASDLGGEPAELVGDLRAEHGENQNPQQPAPFVQRAVAEIKKSQRGNGNHRKANGHHAVEKQERRRDRRTVLRGKSIQSRDHPARVMVHQPAQQTRPLDAHDFLILLVHPADQRQRRIRGCVVKSFERREFFRLIFPHATRTGVTADQLQQRAS